MACAKILGDFTLAGPSGAGGSAGDDGGPIRDSGARDVGQVPEASEAGCPEGARMCQGLAVLTCSNGAFRQTATCPFLCTAGSCTGICTPSDKSCLGSVLRTCQNDGTWDVGVTCPSSICLGGAGTDAGPAHCSGSCPPGSAMCKTATTLSTCDENGEYQDSTCLYVCVASGQSAACGGMCTPDSKQCDGNQPQLCSVQGQWITSSPCPTPMVCVAGSCTGMCANGSTQCNGRTVQNCVNGAWVDNPTPCAFTCYGGACTSCAPGSTSCFGDSLNTCQPDGGDSHTPCPFVCRDGGCTGVCDPGSVRCAGDAGLTTQICTTEGNWLSEATCQNSSCVMGACVGVCRPGSYRCNPGTNVPEVCDVTGNWLPNGSCLYGCNVDAGMCAAGGGG